MRCPRCKAKLKQKQNHWSCPKCKGEWWPYSPGDVEDPGRETRRPLACPACGMPMRIVSMGSDSYRRCPRCRGQWWAPKMDFLRWWLSIGPDHKGPQLLSFKYVPGHGKSSSRSGRKRKKKKWLPPPSERYRLW